MAAPPLFAMTTVIFDRESTVNFSVFTSKGLEPSGGGIRVNRGDILAAWLVFQTVCRIIIKET